MSYPKFELGKSRFDLTTYWGRFLHFINIIDPRTLLVNDAKLNECRQLLDLYRTNSLPSNVTDKDLWEAQKIVQAIVHPDTGEKIFRPFRMAGYVPFGTPIVVGLLLPNPTMKQIIFWQWINQSHNAGVNYANRNATQNTAISKFATGYLSAVTVSVSLAVGLTFAIRRAKSLSPTVKTVVQRFVPLPAVACASTCNVLFMRFHELTEGIEVLDENDKPIGISKIAAKKALTEMAMTRAFLPVPIFLIPPIIMMAFEKNLLRRYPRLSLPLNALACTFSFGLALPVSIAMFPQKSKVLKQELEKEIQEKTNATHVFYNKGL